MLQGAYGEQNQPYHPSQGHHHQPVCPRVLQTEEVGEAYGCYPPKIRTDHRTPGMPSSAATRRILLASASLWTWSRPSALLRRSRAPSLIGAAALHPSGDG